MRCWAASCASQASWPLSGRTRFATRISGRRGAQGEAGDGGTDRVGGGRARLGDQPHAGVAVGEDRLDGGQFDVPAGARLVQPLGGHRHAREPAEDGAQGARGLPLRRQQPAQIAAELLGQGEEHERLGNGGQVDDEEVVGLGERGVAQGAQQGEFLGAGQGGDLLRVQRGGAEEVERGGRALLEGHEAVAEARGGVRSPGGEAGCGLDGAGAGRDAEYGTEGVGAVGAEHEGAAAPAGGVQRGGRGDGGPAGAAGAGDQDGAHDGER